MKFRVASLCAFALLAATAFGASRRQPAPPAAGPQLAHMVFFEIKDKSKEGREAFVATCRKYLAGHDGVAYFSVGVIAEDVVEGPSVRDFDVALHLIFDNKEAEAAYLVNPRHVEFVKVNKSNFGKVRVFDTYITK